MNCCQKEIQVRIQDMNLYYSTTSKFMMHDHLLQVLPDSKTESVKSKCRLKTHFSNMILLFNAFFSLK